MRLPDPWSDSDYWDDTERNVRLTDLGGMKPIPEWTWATWSSCDNCGQNLIGPLDDKEHTWDGEPLVCPECGCVSWMCVDPGGWAVLTDWDFLRPTALAGLRRLLQLEVSDA